MLPQSEYGSAPPSPQDEARDELVFITYNGRQVVLGWSPSLEEAKATACQDLGLAERGYTGKDIAFLFHPANDPSAPLIEVLASAWPKLRPLPHFQLIVRTAENDPPEQAAPHPEIQRTQAGHPSALRTQPSILTNSAKSRKSRESDFASASNTDVSAGSGRVDIESWRRNQLGHFGATLLPSDVHQAHITLPQYALPSPPMSEVPSHRGPSPCCKHSNPSSPSSHHSTKMDIDSYARNEDSRTTSLDPQSDSSNAGFLAQTGRRTTVHFPHTLPNSKSELLALTPIRRSQSQELLNADYTNFKLNQARTQQPKQPHSQHSMRSTLSTNYLARSSAPSSMHGTRETSCPQKTTRLARSYSNIGPLASTQPSTKQSTKPSSLNLSRKPDTSVANTNTMQRGLGHPPLAAASYNSRLRLGEAPSWSSNSGAPLERPTATSLMPPLGMSLDLPAIVTAPRRSSLPDVFDHSQFPHIGQPPFAIGESASASSKIGEHGKNRSGLGDPKKHIAADVPVSDVNMLDDSSDEEGEDRKWKRKDSTPANQSTPKQSSRERTLRRLKSSPSGLSDRYSRHYIPLEVPSCAVEGETSGPSMSQLSSSAKRGPTSWPNSPVKRNASVSSPALFSNAGIPPAPWDALKTDRAMSRTSIARSKAMERPLSPLPPLTALHDTESHSDKAVLSGLLGSAIPQFLLDNRRPDSPLPPLYTHHSLPSSPQTLSMMSAPARSIGKQTLAPLTTTQGDSDMFADILRLPTSHGRVSSRLRSRSSQSTEDLYGNAIDAAMASSGYPTLPRTRSQLNLDSNGKGRRSRTH